MDDINREFLRTQKTISEALKLYPLENITKLSEQLNEVAKKMIMDVQPYLNKITESQEFYKKVMDSIPKITIPNMEIIMPVNHVDLLPFPSISREELENAGANEEQHTDAELLEMIEKIVSLKIEEKIKSEKLNTRHRFPYQLPKTTKWESITTKFIDSENVQMVTDKFSYKAHYSEMGFKDGRNLRPNQQWLFLKSLSTHNGETSLDARDFNRKIKKQKQMLADGLKKYFGIDSDPFYLYKQEKIYRIRINLISESQSINEGLTSDDSVDPDDELGINEAYGDIAKII